MARVSVVIPCYNQGHYLEDAVSSVLDQTCGDFEIIVVNDGSTDPDTHQFLEDYRPPKTRIIHTENRGLPSARNTGIAVATGDYILPLDADDKIGPEYFELALEVLETQSDVGIVYGEAAFFGARSGIWELPEFEMSRMLVSNLIYCSAMFRKSDWERVEGYNPNMLYGWEDWDFWLSIIELGRRVVRIPRLLFHYRTHDDSMIGHMSDAKQAQMRLQICHNHPMLYESLIHLDLTPKIAQLYFDTGQGFNETESVSHMTQIGDQTIEFELDSRQRVKALRFDPANAPVAFKLNRITALNKRKRELTLPAGRHNATYQLESMFLFETEDPWIEVALPSPDIETIRIEIEYLAFGSSIFQYLLAHRHPLMNELTVQVKSLKTRIDDQDQLLRDKTAAIEAKQQYISTLEAELNWIKSLFAWRIINLYRLMGKALTVLKTEGTGVLLDKARNYLGARKKRVRIKNPSKNYKKWLHQNRLTEILRKEALNELQGFKYRPKISILMPVYNVEQRWLTQAIDSVLNQLYPEWELCIADDASTEPHIQEVLRHYKKTDSRINVKRLTAGQGISGASNAALAMATGEFLGLLDHDDQISTNALFENVLLLNRRPDADLIYSDEDKLDSVGNRVEPFFKPDWSPDYFRSLNYISHFTVIRKRLVERVGGFRSGFDGAQDYDLFLRITEATQNIHHIPKILYCQRSFKIEPFSVVRIEPHQFTH